MRISLLLTSAALMGGLFYRKAVTGGRTALVLRDADSRALPEETAEPEVGTVVVYLSGEVLSPGVYELPEGTRVGTLLEAAGGALESADLDRINLAKKLNDGEHIFIPSRGGEDPFAGLVDLNTADVKALCGLPGIGEAKAEAIIRYRERNGPFRSVEELLNVSGIGESLLEGIRDRIRV
ncbi:MAG: ComEA family DNA-binding protein [Lachnospiraceae bacterium]|nr:ComEA family DNA-binding protein [Lachnospiraceae bacterium]